MTSRDRIICRSSKFPCAAVSSRSMSLILFPSANEVMGIRVVIDTTVDSSRGNQHCYSPGSNPRLFENRNRDFTLHWIGRELKHLPKKVKYRRRINMDEMRERIIVVSLVGRRESGLRLCWLFRDDQMASRRILMLRLLSARLAGFSETRRFLLLFIRRKENDDSLLSQPRTRRETDRERERERNLSFSADALDRRR